MAIFRGCSLFGRSVILVTFWDILRQAKTGKKYQIESDPFYTAGYKLKVKIYPNGSGSGKNTHLSMFIVVMKGEYDAILPWPFKKKSENYIDWSTGRSSRTGKRYQTVLFRKWPRMRCKTYERTEQRARFFSVFISRETSFAALPCGWYSVSSGWGRPIIQLIDFEFLSLLLPFR